MRIKLWSEDPMLTAIGWSLGLTAAGVLTWVGVEIHAESVEPKSGVVTSTAYHPPTTTIVCTPSGQTTVCSPIVTPECYEVQYRDGDRDGDACVDPISWREFKAGDEFPGGTR